VSARERETERERMNDKRGEEEVRKCPKRELFKSSMHCYMPQKNKILLPYFIKIVLKT
jgi:uncharacterized iron-regulated protein